MIWTCALTVVLAGASGAMGAWAGGNEQPATAPAPTGGAKPPMSQQELEQLLAPIALYPDSLVSQILMASSYPLEVVQADRWIKANASLKGDALAGALNGQTWDAAVKSLTGFPEVLAMMSEKLEWTMKLGDAFIGQQKQVMDTVQRLRSKAADQGNLESTDQQTVQVQDEGGAQVIVIESTSPDVIYVPRYDPVVVYGAWPYPAYPPYAYYPPGYAAGTAALSFGLGVACGAAWGWAWGDCDWHGGDVNIDVDRNSNFNQNIDRSKIKNELNAKGLGDGKGRWQHDGAHRQGVSYRDNATAQKYGRGTDARTTQSREQFRGRAEAGQRDIARGGADQFKGRSGEGARAGGGERAASGSRQRTAGSSNRAGGGSSAFGGTNRSSSSTRAASSRGHSSRASSAGSRGGGGGGRGGGGRGGGGRGGGGRR
jgi:hypothetical protein